MSAEPIRDQRIALHLQATVQSGNKIEITSNELQEGDSVDVFLVIPNRVRPSHPSIVEFLDSLPAGPRSYVTWADFDRRFQEERDAWDR